MTQIINQSTLEEFHELGMIEVVISNFRERNPKEKKLIDELIENDESLEKLGHKVHAYKNTCSHMGLERVCRILKECEIAFQNGQAKEAIELWFKANTHIEKDLNQSLDFIKTLEDNTQS